MQERHENLTDLSIIGCCRGTNKEMDEEVVRSEKKSDL